MVVVGGSLWSGAALEDDPRTTRALFGAMVPTTNTEIQHAQRKKKGKLPKLLREICQKEREQRKSCEEKRLN